MSQSPPPWVIRFRHLAEDDAVVAEFENVEIQTREDAERWAREVDIRLRSFGRKVDLLINLDGLDVKPGASREFGRRRAQILAKHVRSSYRFGGNRSTVTSVLTSAVIEQTASNVYASFAEAREALLRARREEGSSPKTSTVPSRSPTTEPLPRPATRRS